MPQAVLKVKITSLSYCMMSQSAVHHQSFPELKESQEILSSCPPVCVLVSLLCSKSQTVPGFWRLPGNTEAAQFRA